MKRLWRTLTRRSTPESRPGQQGSGSELRYTFDWFSRNIPLWQATLGHLAGQPGLRFLEIGTFEGRATIWLLTNILTHETATMECIECFEGVWEWESQVVDMAEVERRFEHNIRVAGVEHKVLKIRGSSREVLRTRPTSAYDMIYIDGSHVAADVLEDAVLSFTSLKPGGILIFDDYGLARDHERNVPRIAIDAFLTVYLDRYQLLHQDYQVILKKAWAGTA